jgi:hypothetical protein
MFTAQVRDDENNPVSRAIVQIEEAECPSSPEPLVTISYGCFTAETDDSYMDSVVG